MLKLISLAARNLLRNTRRTVLTTAAIAFGLAVMVFMITFATGTYNDMLRKGVSQLAGHVVVQAPGFQDSREPTLVVTGSDSVAATLRQTFPDAVITQRLQLGGLLTSSASSVGAGLAGVVPADEAEISELDDKLVDGEWLAPDDARGIVIGRTMADQLDVGLGGKIVYMGQQKGQAEMQSRLFRVRGIFRTGGTEMDGFLAVIHLDAARELLTVDDAAGQVAVHLTNARDADAATLVARAAVDRPDLDVLSWKAAIPELVALIEVDKESNDFLLVIIGFIVALGVLNTVLMSVLERTREFGMLMAVGMPRRSIAALVLLEGATLGFVGAVLGVALGAIPSWYSVTYGIDLTAYMGEQMSSGGISLDALMMGGWDVPRIAQYFVGAVLFTVAAAAWPAWRVTRLQPVDAMRHH
ncbi:MAG: ABC-type lipoprotein release transport system permease subunit [Myxococcota bacterium]|jgi:ABC-type lipoprotein release transport system permease subunit